LKNFKLEKYVNKMSEVNTFIFKK